MSDELIIDDSDGENKALMLADRERMAEIRTIAAKLARSYGEMVNYYIEYEKLKPQEATTKAGNDPPELLKQWWDEPPEQVSWWTLGALKQQHPELAVAKWEEVKDAAREDVVSGHYSFSKVMESSPYDRAIYLAVREAFVDQWQPQNSGEQLLVDQLAQLYCAYLFWMGRLELRANVDSEIEDGTVKRTGKWKPSFDHGTTPEWFEQTGAMVDRFNRLFLRTMRALRDLRRWAVNVNITNPGQVNIGAQQVNAQQIKRTDVEREETN